jgi:hypothetical protein
MVTGHETLTITVLESLPGMVSPVVALTAVRRTPSRLILPIEDTVSAGYVGLSRPIKGPVNNCCRLPSTQPSHHWSKRRN